MSQHRRLYSVAWLSGFLGLSIFFALLQHSSSAVAEGLAGNWAGRYTGQLDGRNAELRIIQRNRNAARVEYLVVLRDIDRGMAYGATRIVPFGPMDHIISDLTLTQIETTLPREQRGTKVLGQIFLHAWNNNVISGYTDHQGKEYGVLFSRIGFQSSVPPHPRLSTLDLCQWAGKWGGYLDGRNSTLEIKPHHRDPYGQNGLTITMRDGDYLAIGTAPYPNSFERDTSLDRRVLRNVRLNQVGGSGVKIFGALYMHSFNYNYLSGFTGPDPRRRSGVAYARVATDEGAEDPRSACIGPARHDPWGTGGTGSSGGSCDSDLVGQACMGAPPSSECFARGTDLSVPGRYVCRSRRLKCDTSRSSGTAYCSRGGGACGGIAGNVCSINSECAPSLSCTRFGRCQPVTGCAITPGTCWTPEDLNSTDPALCRATGNIPVVPGEYTVCPPAEIGKICSTRSIECPGFAVPGTTVCTSTGPVCQATTEGRRMCEAR